MEQKNTPLTRYEEQLLGRLRFMQGLDKSSQDRLRKEIDDQRKRSKAFEEAFGGALAGQKVERDRGNSIFRSMSDAILHPIREVKGVVGEALIRARNKAPEILVHPHPTLSKIAEPWVFDKENGAELLNLVRGLGAALRGVDYGERLGMAAPQIGISKRVFVCMGAVCVNPTWTSPKVGEKVDIIESCYSLPNKQVYKTRRDKYGFAEWYSVDGVLRKFKLKGTDAIVFQHEIDHLDGKCSCDIGVLYTPEEHAKSIGK